MVVFCCYLSIINNIKLFILTDILICFHIYFYFFLGYYELVNKTVNDISHKSNNHYLAKLKNTSLEKDELLQTAKVNAREAR